MKRLLQKNVFIFATDLIMSVAASFVAILIVRYSYSAVPEFDHYVVNWCLGSLIVSSIAIAISKTNLIVFKYASFKSVANIFLCAIIKSSLMSIPLLLGLDFIIHHSILLILLDFGLTIIFITIQKLSVLLYKTKEEEEEEEERAVNCLNAVIYGLSPKSIAAITRFKKSKHYRILAIVTKDRSMGGKIIMDYPVIAIPEDITNFHIKDVEAVIFPKYEEWQEESDNLVKQLVERGICVMTLPAAESTNYPGLELKEIKHILETNFIPDNMSDFERATKRVLDFTISSGLIVVFAIPMLIIYLAVLINDGKPVIFKQERIGRFGRPFNILKFRTMKLDAESNGPALYSGEDDPRMTKLGKFLRTHHLDELPQLFNVWKGEMSFVGYRPERKVFIDKIVEKDPRYAYLYQIRPGVTSYATLRNGYTDTLDKMLRRLKFDLYYLNHRSLALDLKVLWDTFMNIAVGKKF